MPTAESETNPVPDDARFFRQSISPHPIGRSSKARHCSSLPPSSASAESYSAGQMLTPEHPHGLPYRLRYDLPSARTAVGPVRSTSPSLLRVSAPLDALIGVRAGVALCGRTPLHGPCRARLLSGCGPLPVAAAAYTSSAVCCLLRGGRGRVGVRASGAAVDPCSECHFLRRGSCRPRLRSANGRNAAVFAALLRLPLSSLRACARGALITPM